MGHGISVESAEAEVGSLIHEAAILSSQREVLAQEEVPTGAVNECAPGLAVCPRHQRVVGWVEHQGSTFGQHIGTQAQPSRAGQTEDKSTRCLVDISLYS